MAIAKSQGHAAEIVTPVEQQRIRARLESDLRDRLVAFENRYEIASADVEEAVNRGLVRETAEVAEWIVLRRALVRLERAEPTRAQ